MRTPNRRQRRGKPGSLANLKTELWHAVKCAADLLDDDDTETRLRGCHAMSQLAGAYRALCEADDLEREITELKEQLRTHTEQYAADRRAGLLS